MSKRMFTLFCAVFCSAVFASAKPIMRVAFITDTHVKEKPESAVWKRVQYVV